MNIKTMEAVIEAREEADKTLAAQEIIEAIRENEPDADEVIKALYEMTKAYISWRNYDE